jgi:hypothetical protein
MILFCSGLMAKIGDAYAEKQLRRGFEKLR